VVNLGEWIETLQALPPAMPIEYPRGFGAPLYIGELISWRGIYQDLTLPPVDESFIKTVGDALANAQAAVGATFTGYKGGDYTMHESTYLWADPYGRSVGSRVLGIAVVSGSVHVIRRGPNTEEGG
jgi:hypothetical protein